MGLVALVGRRLVGMGVWLNPVLGALPILLAAGGVGAEASGTAGISEPATLYRYQPGFCFSASGAAACTRGTAKAGSAAAAAAPASRCRRVGLLMSSSLS